MRVQSSITKARIAAERPDRWTAGSAARLTGVRLGTTALPTMLSMATPSHREPATSATIARLRAAYPSLADLDDATLADALAGAVRAEAPAGATLFDEGAACRGFPLVLDGEVRVARGASDGRELELYRVGSGEVCVASAAGLISGSPLLARGVATRRSELLLLTPAAFERLAAQPAFRRFVFGLMATRLAELMGLVEAVAFQRLDRRLAAALLGHGPVLAVTHAALADELGTVREIVTRLLHRFERAGWLRLGRERIEIVDAAALRRAAGDGA